MRDRLSVQFSTTRKEKDHILKVYADHSINKTARILELIRADVKKLEGVK